MNRELITEIARGVVKDIGYDQDGFSWHGADVEVLLHGQSPDIAMGVNAKKKKGGEEEGAGDQGMMFGFACTESEVYEKGSFMPAPIFFAHKILRTLSEQRRSGKLFDLQPDAKSQVTVQYVDGKAVGCTKVVVSTQHNAQNRNGKKYTPGMVRDLIATAVESSLPKGWMPKKPSDFLVNPTGNFVVGGPDGDCGLTGRKIIVDTYGGYAPHGGGAFSGKDPTKVDRSAAYAARYLAKNVVAAGLAERCTIQVAYAIGVADPMSLLVDTHGTGKVDERKLEKILPRDVPPHADQHPPLAEAQQADLPPHRGLRPFRPRARTRTAASRGRRPISRRSSRRRSEIAHDPRKPARTIRDGRFSDKDHAQSKMAGACPAILLCASRSAMTDEHDPTAERAFFGRRKGHPLRARQAELFDTLLPRLALNLSAPAPDNLAALFPLPVDDVRLEIGFGGAEHLIAQARGASAHGFHRLRAVRQRHGQGARGDRRAKARQYPAASRRRGRLARLAAARHRSRASICSIPIPGRSGATGSGVSSTRRTSRGSRACCGRAANSASRPTGRTTPNGPCGASRARANSSGPPSAPTTGASRGRASSARATRRRRSARAACPAI